MTGCRPDAADGLRLLPPPAMFHVKHWNVSALRRDAGQVQKSINLVSPESSKDLWRRHMLDSAAAGISAAGGQSLVDMGSGAGFPGLVLAILGVPNVHP